jgi:hypothetical protein
MINNKVKPITLEIDKNLWEKFKVLIPRTKTLNDAIVELIALKIKSEELNKTES